MAAFQFVDLETGEVVDTDEPVKFWMHLRRKLDAEVTAWHDARIAALGGRVMLNQARADRDYTEAMAAQREEVQAGKNAETRKAILDQFLHEDEYFRGHSEAVTKWETDVATYEADAEAAHSRYRGTLRDLEVMAALYGGQRADG